MRLPTGLKPRFPSSQINYWTSNISVITIIVITTEHLPIPGFESVVLTDNVSK